VVFFSWPAVMGYFSCFDLPADEQPNPKLGGASGCGASSSAAAAYGAGSGAGQLGDRGYPDLQQAPMVAPRVEKLSAGA
jgi:serine/threonine-protein kinase PBS1